MYRPVDADGEPGQPLATPLWSDPAALAPESSWQPRIAPSPPSRKPTGIVLVTLLVGLLVFGSAGFFAGMSLAPEHGTLPQPSPSGASSAAGEASLPAYEANQLTLNQAKFDGDLATLAKPWLPWIGGCTSSSDARGPKLETGEETRIFCEYSNINVYFIRYKSLADRDKARIDRQRQNLDAQVLTPGVAPASQKTGHSGDIKGDYVEFAYRAGSGTAAQTICGVWWDNGNDLVGAYLEVPWADGLGEKWAPLRDVWERHS